MKGCPVSARVLELAFPHCSADDFDGEIVAINLDTGIYYSVKDSAALVWHDLVDGHSVEALLEVVQGKPETHAALAQFADALLTSGLMRPSNAAREPAGPARIASAFPAMEAPVLEPFGDMQDLLLLDPVHEVDEEMGWPNTPGEKR